MVENNRVVVGMSGEVDFFVASNLLKEKGNDVEEWVVGLYDDLIYYTLGQQHWIGIGDKGNGQPWYVIENDVEHTILYVSQGANHPTIETVYKRNHKEVSESA